MNEVSIRNNEYEIENTNKFFNEKHIQIEERLKKI